MNELGDRFVFFTAVVAGLASFAMPPAIAAQP